MSDQEPPPLIEGHHHHDVRIHIDRTERHSPNPTTGTALYALGNVQPGYVLFREARGDHEDAFVPDTDHELHLHVDEHFYSTVLEFTIIVNTEDHKVSARDVSYAQIVAFAFPKPIVPPAGKTVDYTVSYRHGPRKNHEGTLLQNTSVEIRNGMIFDVTATITS